MQDVCNISREWRWRGNTSRIIAEGNCALNPGPGRLRLGRPQATEYYTVEELESKGLVGEYIDLPPGKYVQEHLFRWVRSDR